MNLSSESRFREAVDALDALGYDTAPLRQQHSVRERVSHRAPNASDAAFPLNTPVSWNSHFAAGEPPVLSNSTLRVGARLTLSPGQRAVLRERYEMTPTKVVEVAQIELFEGTRLIRELVLVSDLHIPTEFRRRILKECRISDFGAWYSSSIERDAERAAEGEGTKPSAKQASTSVPSTQELEQFCP